MSDIHIEPAPRRVEGKFNQGWGFAGFIVALAVACAVGAWYIHSTTYIDPLDVRNHAVGAEAEGH